jgi:hypothetical protein
VNRPASVSLERFYAVLQRLIDLRDIATLQEVVSRRDLPARGVYFLFDERERRRETGDLREVRVGTHAMKRGARSTLRGRLRQHLGARAGHGNHRGSVFRLHVGAALLARDGSCLPSWGVGSSAPAEVRQAEREHEQRVSRYVCELYVVTLGIDDDPGPTSLRSFVERNAIALLSTAGRAVDSPSAGWLGHAAQRAPVRASGLWNVNHVGERVEASFLERFEEIVPGS